MSDQFLKLISAQARLVALGPQPRAVALLDPNRLLGLSNAVHEWQAGTLERKQRINGGLPTRGACYPFLYAVTLL